MRMPIIKSKRRWLQFSLRSLLLLTLLVAGWLGYEVRQVRPVERQTAAIEALGGQVEFEPRGPSVLRYVLQGRYGQQIVAAEIPGAAAGKALEPLAAMPYLRQLRVAYDGTRDLHPDWDRLTEALPHVDVGATAAEPSDDAYEQRLKRMLTKVKNGPSRVCGVWRQLGWTGRPTEDSFFTWDIAYHVLPLEDGTLAELLLCEDRTIAIPGFDEAFAVLIVGDQAVDGAAFSVYTRHGTQTLQLIDLDGDGTSEVGFQFNDRRIWSTDEGAQQMPNDPRLWLGLYKINGDGFQSLLPEKRPNPQ